MNCKPGDLAVVIRSDFQTNIGRLVTVLGFSPDSTFEFPEWECKAISEMMSFHVDDGVILGEHPVRSGELIDMEDSALRPIRDPGDDATDETLEWLPVPTKEGQPA